MSIARIIWILLFIQLLSGNIYAQYTRQLRISEDDDYLNIRGDGTDKGYSSGLQIAFFYNKQTHRFFIDRWMPKAGADAINTYSIGINHLIFTPENLQLTNPVINDYPYAGALYLNHSLHSYSKTKKYNLQTNVILGVMGPLSFAEEIQTFVHSIIGDEYPKGWGNQLPTDILINVNVSAEKQLLQLGNWFEGIAGAQVLAGSMIDAIGAYAIIRAGKMNAYFDGWMVHRGTPSDKKSRWQVYLFAKPAVQAVAYNALLQGGIVLNRKKIIKATLQHFTRAFDYGMVVAYRNIGISFTQKAFSGPVKGLQGQETGNITLSFSW